MDTPASFATSPMHVNIESFEIIAFMSFSLNGWIDEKNYVLILTVAPGFVNMLSWSVESLIEDGMFSIYRNP